MRYKITILPLLIAGLLASCNDNEEMIKNNPEFVEAGYGALTLTLKYPDGAKTKAVGDTLVGVAYDTEKTIKSVAFFVDTEEETANGVVQSGAFGGYFSDEEVLSANGLQEELTEVTAGAPGEYTAKIRHRSDGWANPKVIVIANYLENSLATKLKSIASWDELAQVVSETVTANPKSPLLMYSTKTIDAWKRTGGGNGGGAATADFDMDRLVSRVDIHNNAFDKTTPGNGFVLTSARLIRPKTASYLIPGITGRVSQPVSSELFATSGKVVEEGVAPNIIQKLDSLYAYENDNTDPATATAVEINGTFRGGLISKVIPFKKADGVGTTGASIALARNHRYVVNLNAAPDSTDITWDIVVKEWTESDTIKVKPTFAKPDLATALNAAVFSAGTSGLSYTAGSKVIDITTVAAGDATLKFTVTGTTASIAEVAYEFDKDGSSIAGNKDIIETGDPIVSYGSAKVETPFTINIPKQNDDEKVPMDIYVIICNGGNLNARDTIIIKSRPVYNKVTGAQPVMMKDGKYWAPINVGATQTDNKANRTANTNITASCGWLFQWGRKYGFDSTNEASVCVADTTSIGALGRPVRADLTNMAKWDRKFIYPTAIMKSNWLQINGDGKPNPENADMVKGAWYQQLWNANEGKNNADVLKTDADPCPKGWRIPTKEEWIAIGAGKSKAEVGTDWDATNFRLVIPAKENGKNMLLPGAGYRKSDTGESTDQGYAGYYWSSSVPATSIAAERVVFHTAGELYSSYNIRSYGFSVRCIQE